MARAMERKKRRLACDLRFEGRRFTGLVLDLSPSGLFIQTSAKAKPGDVLELELSVPGERSKLALQVQVVRKKVVPARLRSVAQGGLGVRIMNAPEAYYGYMTALRVEVGDSGAGLAPDDGGESEPDPAPESESRVPRFRVRVSQTSGPRSRRLEVEAPDEEAARQHALEEVGVGWRVLEVESL